ncbi:glycosyltransferase [Rathayibacter agropyri]|uniref:glycosyltransferase n=1 Tax=Rathayibacter agropyri TaxID=1634927 RepID=UPI001566D389|nr:glycosyltransferase [Rathayibacter agropyri]NRD08061.1 glycosyltransferase [Rathayibacter agropyri]
MTEPITLDISSATQLAYALTAHVAAEIGVRSICVKGPVLAQQGLRSPRVSSDADVLVDPEGMDSLVEALRARGWKERFVANVPRILSNHARTLFHPEWPCDIDVHHSFLGFLAPEREVFEVLWERRRTTRIADTEVLCMDPVANSAMLALHCLREMHVLRNRSEFAELTAAWDHSRNELELDPEDLLSLARKTGSVETLRPFLTRIGVDAPVAPFDTKAFAAWTLHTSSVAAGRAAAWLAAITSSPWENRPRLLAQAILPPAAEYRLEHPEIGPRKLSLARAMLRRTMNGVRALPPALLQLAEARRLQNLTIIGSPMAVTPTTRTRPVPLSSEPPRGQDGMSKSVAIIGTRGYPSFYGGFETAVRQLAPYLAERGWDVTVYGRDGSTDDDNPARDHRVRTRITRGIESKSLSTLTYGLTACIDAVRRKPDVALVMNVANGFWLPILRARGIPTVTNVDGIEWDRAKWGRLAKNVFRSGAKATAIFGDELIYDAVEIARRWKKDFKRDGSFIPYGGDDPGALPEVEGFPHRGYVLLVARFVPENTVPEFLEAAATLGRNWPVVIVGSSGYGDELDQKAASLAAAEKNVTWLGHVSDDRQLFALWQHAGAYFHGHSVGGTNPALTQAMSCGAPTVARDTVYNREVLDSTGEFVAPSPEAIAASIDALMRDPERQERMSAAAYARGRERYSWEVVCAAYEDALLGQLARKRRAR